MEQAWRLLKRKLSGGRGHFQQKNGFKYHLNVCINQLENGVFLWLRACFEGIVWTLPFEIEDESDL